jgi:hypothetical protein
MMRNSMVVAGIGAVVALGLIGYGCSSSNGGGGGTGGHTGTGGSTTSGSGGSTTTGSGGSTTAGSGGSTATGSGGSTTTGAGGSTTTGAGGSTTTGNDASTGTVTMCNPAPDDKSACVPGSVTSPCTKNCGANIVALSALRAQKPCACNTVGATSTWDCTNAGPCVYPAGLDPTCFHLATPPAVCPTDLTDGGSGLLRPNISTCTLPAGMTCGLVCGSATVASYQDSKAAPKMGYCTCLAGKYQCASVNEWPAQ